MLLILSGQPCLLCAPYVPCLYCVHRPLSAPSGFWSFFSSTPLATNKNIPLSSFNWHWHWHLDGTDDSEVFHNVILICISIQSESPIGDRWKWKCGSLQLKEKGNDRSRRVLDYSWHGDTIAQRGDVDSQFWNLPIAYRRQVSNFPSSVWANLEGELYLGQGGWGWKTCAGVSATMPCAVTSKVG